MEFGLSNDDLMSGRTSNGGAFFQVVAGTAPKVDGDGAFGRGFPCEVDGLAGLGVQAGGGDVERVGSVGLAALSENKQGGGGNSQEGRCGETHVDVVGVGLRLRDFDVDCMLMIPKSETPRMLETKGKMG